GQVTAHIDCFPAVDEGMLSEMIIRTFDTQKNKMFKNVFKKIAPVGTHTALLHLIHTIDPLKKVHSITKEERNMIVRLLKTLPIEVSGLMGFDRAVVADGGVSLAEIDMKTLRSKLCANL